MDELTCLSTFTGLGGMDLGLEAAGFAHVACVEWDEAARQSIKANGKLESWNLLGDGDIAVVAQRLRPTDLGLDDGELDLLAGAPPCQPYSTAAQWTAGGRRGLEDRRGQYLDDFLVLLERFLPKVAVVENVRGFVQGSTSALGHIEARLDEVEARTGARYRVVHAVLDAVDFGVPQRRSRAIVIITRLDRPFEWPTHRGHRVAWDALCDVRTPEDGPVARGKWAELLPSIPEGENYLFHTERGGGERLFGYRTRYWSFLLKLAKSQPSWTLSAHPGPATGPFHWDNRPLTVEELLRLQSFDASWRVEGSSRIDRVRQVGNATPPLLAEVLGRSIVAHIDPDASFVSTPTFDVPSRRPIPGPRRPSAIPARFRSQIDDHPAHPGHGKGPGARAAQADLMS